MIDKEKNAKDYLETYRNKISTKFQEQKKEKELFENLDLSIEERNEIEDRMKKELRLFVKSLQDEKNYDKFKKIYNDSMGEVKKFYKVIKPYSQGDKSKSEINDKEVFIKLKKDYFNKDISLKQRNKIVDLYDKYIQNLSSYQKKQFIEMKDRMILDKKYFKEVVGNLEKNLSKIQKELPTYFNFFEKQSTYLHSNKKNKILKKKPTYFDYKSFLKDFGNASLEALAPTAVLMLVL
jgi:hypothetical protein